MARNYSWVTTDMFDEKLLEIVGRLSPAEILATPGVYEVLSEALNNDVLDELSDERAALSEVE